MNIELIRDASKNIRTLLESLKTKRNPLMAEVIIFILLPFWKKVLIDEINKR